MARIRLALIPVVALALALAGCGGQQQEYADAIAASVQQDSADLRVTQEQSQCVGDTFVDILGVETFEQAGVTPDQIRGGANPLSNPTELGIDKAEAGKLFDGLDKCLDVKNLVAQGISQQSLPKQQQQCLMNALSNDLLRKLFVAQLTGQGVQGNPQLQRELLGAVSQCVG